MGNQPAKRFHLGIKVIYCKKGNLYSPAVLSKGGYPCGPIDFCASLQRQRRSTSHVSRAASRSGLVRSTRQPKRSMRAPPTWNDPDFNQVTASPELKSTWKTIKSPGDKVATRENIGISRKWWFSLRGPPGSFPHAPTEHQQDNPCHSDTGLWEMESTSVIQQKGPKPKDIFPPDKGRDSNLYHRSGG